MMWVVLALIGHTLNGAAFVIDKALLSTALKRSATYATMIGGLSLLVALAIPFVHEWPTRSTMFAVVGFGMVFVFALWAFFEALKNGEATRVVPIVGSLIPIFTLLGTTTLLGERLVERQYVGFVILLIATWLLTTGHAASAISKSTLAVCIVAAILFAASTIFGKYAFNHHSFLGVFVTSRIVAGLTGVGIGLMIPAAGREVLSIFHPRHRSKRSSGSWAILGQTLGAIGFVFVTMAIQQGSASIVNAMQAVQYAFLVIVAFALRNRAPQLLNERLDRKTVATKVTALVLTGVGLLLVI